MSLYNACVKDTLGSPSTNTLTAALYTTIKWIIKLELMTIIEFEETIRATNESYFNLKVL